MPRLMPRLGALLRNPWIHRLLSLGLGGLFLYAAHDKVIDPRPFVTILWNYRLLPPGPINLMAIYMPFLEVVVGIALITGFMRRGAALLSTGLLIMFIGALGINAMRGLDVACGCFSTSSTDVSNAWLLVLRDVPMLLAAAWMLFFPPRD